MHEEVRNTTMLDRTYIVPEIKVSEEETQQDIEECIYRLVILKKEVSEEDSPGSSRIETELSMLFSRVGGEKIVSEMERVVVLLCKIAHKLVRCKNISQENEMVLLQIFELGLFMVQFKDRWLERLEKTEMLDEHSWTPSVAYQHVSSVFFPARELVSLAQEYLLRKETLEDKRCDICAFALANSLQSHHITLALLLRQKKEERKDLGCFFFIAYVFAESEEAQGEILRHWFLCGALRFNTTLFYLPGIDLLQFFRMEIGKVSDYQTLQNILLSASSHVLIHAIGESFFLPHKKGKVSTQELSEVLLRTYTEEESDSTEEILKDICAYNPIAAETITKHLIIYKKTTKLASRLFSSSSIIDKDYVECAIICKDAFHLIPCAKLKELCSSDYLALLCKKPGMFRVLLGCVEKTYKKNTVITAGETKNIQYGWNLHFFVARVLGALDMSVGMFRKAFLLVEAFPWMEMYVKKCLWDETDTKGSPAKSSPPGSLSLEELEMLGMFREIPCVQNMLLKAFKKHSPQEVEKVLFAGTPDVFLIQWLKKKIAVHAKERRLGELCKYFTELKNKEDMHGSTYWEDLLKKKIVFGKTVSLLSSILPQDELLYHLYYEGDIARLLKPMARCEVPNGFLISSLLERLDTQSKYDSGAVLGSTSFISVPVSTKKLTVYLTMVQKEFSEKQSIVRFVGDKSSLEVYVLNGKGKISYATYKDAEREEEITDIDEEFEKHPLGGWKISLAITVTPKGYLLKIGETEISQKVSPKSLEEVVIGERFKGILKRALLLEESRQYPDRQSTKPSEAFFQDVLLNIEKTMQYHRKFAVLIESSTPYHISGLPSKIRMGNVFTNKPSYWRCSESFTRLVAKMSSKHPVIEQKALSFAFPQEKSSTYHLI
ncbi:hypothetical protein NECID01_0542 [Nematocida sp. AWRm77]|nr:hypothetical protein NECID01_0542 [Nematocida sp. AWRm77]